MDALLYGLGILLLAVLGTAARWADRELQKPAPRRRKLAERVQWITLWTFYLAFAAGFASVLYAIGTWHPPACDPTQQVCQ